MLRPWTAVSLRVLPSDGRVVGWAMCCGPEGLGVAQKGVPPLAQLPSEPSPLSCLFPAGSSPIEGDPRGADGEGLRARGRLFWAAHPSACLRLGPQGARRLLERQPRRREGRSGGSAPASFLPGGGSGHGAREEACSRALRGEREFTAARGGSGGLWEAEKGRDEQEAGEGAGSRGLARQGQGPQQGASCRGQWTWVVREGGEEGCGPRGVPPA